MLCSGQSRVSHSCTAGHHLPAWHNLGIPCLTTSCVRVGQSYLRQCNAVYADARNGMGCYTWHSYGFSHICRPCVTVCATNMSAFMQAWVLTPTSTLPTHFCSLKPYKGYTQCPASLRRIPAWLTFHRVLAGCTCACVCVDQHRGDKRDGEGGGMAAHQGCSSGRRRHY